MAAMHEQTFECGGQFLSLEAWQANGFDAEAIITNTEANDKDQHPALGETVYRVRQSPRASAPKKIPSLWERSSGACLAVQKVGPCRILQKVG